MVFDSSFLIVYVVCWMNDQEGVLRAIRLQGPWCQHSRPSVVGETIDTSRGKALPLCTLHQWQDMAQEVHPHIEAARINFM